MATFSLKSLSELENKVADKLRKLVCPHLVVFRGYSLRPSALIFDFCGVNVGDECVNNVSQMIKIFNENDHYVLNERLDIIKQATLGLKTLHHFGIVHRDFKPSNLLVTGTLNKLCVKLTDFDDLSLIQETIHATLTNKPFLLGMTLAYTAPEICKQEVKSPSFKSDIYSWSMSAYEVLSGYESPWVKIIPILNDSLLIEALSQDKRPNINDLNQFYTFNDETWVFKMICNAWDKNPEVRKDIDKILKTLNKDRRSKQAIKPKQETKNYPLNERRQLCYCLLKLTQKKTRCFQNEKAEKFYQSKSDPENLEKKFINDYKGFGVFTTTEIGKGEFVAVYQGV
ncbi:probable serine/threonine-protein kinase DDB_G0272254 [Hydra vulgaris]|uniref:Probable serine/threonine-protein kinase DDB_G0272254 n=1 Tax=Hydra vulgaris TaxID=6087 RepID=A0ABM4C054_HYDVU